MFVRLVYKKKSPMIKVRRTIQENRQELHYFKYQEQGEINQFFQKSAPVIETICQQIILPPSSRVLTPAR